MVKMIIMINNDNHNNNRHAGGFATQGRHGRGTRGRGHATEHRGQQGPRETECAINTYAYTAHLYVYNVTV